MVSNTSKAPILAQRETPDILQWNCCILPTRKAELVLRLQFQPIPVLALSEGAVPHGDTIAGFIKYVSTRISTFPHGSAALYVRQTIPPCELDTSLLPYGDFECVAMRLSLHGRHSQW